MAAMTRIVVLRKVVLGVLVLAASISVVRGINNAWHHSQDFQWNPEVQFVRGIDPCKFYLEKHTQFLAQIPPYGHFIYIMFLPFGFMSFTAAKVVWSLLNVGFAVSIFYFLRSKFPDRQTAIVFLSVFLCSTPFRESMYNGQQTLLTLFLVVLSVYVSEQGRSGWAAFLGGVAAFKYSFGVPLFPAYIRKPWTAVPAYVLAPLIGIVVYAIRFHNSLQETVFLPLRVTLAPNAHGPGATDLLTLLQQHQAGWLTFALPLGLLLTIVVAERIWLAIDGLLDRCAFFTVVAFLLALHIPYDQVFLLLPAVAVLKARPNLRYAVWAIIVYFGYASLYLGELWAHLSVEPGHTWPPYGRVKMLPYNHLLMWLQFVLLTAHFVEKRYRPVNGATPHATSTLAALSGKSSPKAR